MNLANERSLISSKPVKAPLPRDLRSAAELLSCNYGVLIDTPNLRLRSCGGRCPPVRAFGHMPLFFCLSRHISPLQNRTLLIALSILCTDATTTSEITTHTRNASTADASITTRRILRLIERPPRADDDISIGGDSVVLPLHAHVSRATPPLYYPCISIPCRPPSEFRTYQHLIISS